ncbi:MAG: hypothetical protein ACYDC6_03980 [Acidobacteriaceae bacterium]
MRISSCWLRRQIAVCLVMFLAVPFGEAAIARPQQALPGQQTEDASSGQAQSQTSSSATTKPATDNGPSATSPAAPAASNPAVAQTVDSNQPAGGVSQSSPEQPQQNGGSNPVGTAAAPYEKTTGVAASRPAGAVIAPAKQKRARSILIRVGVLLGACVAIGTVVALSSASPSRP